MTIVLKNSRLYHNSYVCWEFECDSVYIGTTADYLHVFEMFNFNNHSPFAYQFLFPFSFVS